jgi:transposase
MPTGYKQKEKINHTCEGTSVFVSSADLPIDQVLPLFCTKNKANKDFGMLTGFPVGNSLQAIKGQFLVLFIASMITSLLDKEFSSQGLDIGRIFHELRNQKCTVSNGYAIPGKTLNTIDYRYRSLLVDQPFLISP